MSIRERVSPSVPFTLEVEDNTGKFSYSFRLAYNFRTLGLIEKHTGKSMLTEANDVFANPTCNNVAILFWAALQINHPEWRGEDGLSAVHNNLTLLTAKKAKDACEEAFVKQLPEEKIKQMAADKSDSAAPLAQSQETSA
jgi:hypothetical protein